MIKNEIITSLSKYQLLIIDDLGAERTSEYMQETIFNIIDARYRSGLPMIITTNLDISDIWNQDGIGHGRIYDRILERCIPVKVDGSSRRKEELKKICQTLKIFWDCKKGIYTSKYHEEWRRLQEEVEMYI